MAQKNENVNEELLQKVEAMQLELESLKTGKSKPKSPYVARIKEMVQRSIFNTIDDLPTTLHGVAPAAGIIWINWPNVQAEDIMMAFGLAGVGSISTSKGSKRQSKTPPAEIPNKNFEEFG